MTERPPTRRRVILAVSVTVGIAFLVAAYMVYDAPSSPDGPAIVTCADALCLMESDGDTPIVGAVPTRIWTWSEPQIAVSGLSADFGGIVVALDSFSNEVESGIAVWPDTTSDVAWYGGATTLQQGVVSGGGRAVIPAGGDVEILNWATGARVPVPDNVSVRALDRTHTLGACGATWCIDGDLEKAMPAVAGGTPGAAAIRGDTAWVTWQTAEGTQLVEWSWLQGQTVARFDATAGWIVRVDANDQWVLWEVASGPAPGVYLMARDTGTVSQLGTGGPTIPRHAALLESSVAYTVRQTNGATDVVWQPAEGEPRTLMSLPLSDSIEAVAGEGRFVWVAVATTGETPAAQLVSLQIPSS